MRFNVVINQAKALEMQITLSEAALLSLFNELSSWADERVIDGKVYYHISRNKVIDELPFFYRKPDTVYRHFVNLCDLGYVDYLKQKGKDFIRLTTSGKGYNKLGNKSEFVSNSEINPSKFGNKSEFQKEVNLFDYQLFTFPNSEINPTYNNNNTSNNSLREDLLRLKNENLQVFDAFLNAPTFYENIMRQVSRKRKHVSFQKDVVPMYLKWLINKLDAGALNKNIPTLKSMCLSYLVVVFENESTNEQIIVSQQNKHLRNAI
ncbi:hypothetical protein [Mesoflavibacter profundi]|uniref:hypothetical protein n=1 Tax=Mesoflavibacter profundi TaxID=2708110 RepID=UPI0035149B3E